MEQCSLRIFVPPPVFCWGMCYPQSTRYLGVWSWKRFQLFRLDMKGYEILIYSFWQKKLQHLNPLQHFSDASKKYRRVNPKNPNGQVPVYLFCLGNPGMTTTFRAAPPPQKHVRHSICPRTWKATPWGKTTNTAKTKKWMLKATTCEKKLMFPVFLCFWWEVSTNKHELQYLQTFSGVVDEKYVNVENLQENPSGWSSNEVGG